jgi:hypothetical protein
MRRPFDEQEKLFRQISKLNNLICCCQCNLATVLGYETRQDGLEKLRNTPIFPEEKRLSGNVKE